MNSMPIHEAVEQLPRKFHVVRVWLAGGVRCVGYWNGSHWASHTGDEPVIRWQELDLRPLKHGAWPEVIPASPKPKAAARSFRSRLAAQWKAHGWLLGRKVMNA